MRGSRMLGRARSEERRAERGYYPILRLPPRRYAPWDQAASEIIQSAAAGAPDTLHQHDPQRASEG